MALSVFIVDDEELIRNELKYLLERNPEIEVVGEAESAFEAIIAIKEKRPDAVFLDIKLGEVDGITLARKIRETEPRIKIVFVTALDNHAVESFELDALDYLLKPVSEERLDRTVARLLENSAGAQAAPPAPYADRIAVKHNQIWKLIDIGDIYYFNTKDHTTTAHTKSEVYSLNYPLRELEEQLDPENFLRTHKSYIVNVNLIDEIIPWFNYTYKITFREKAEELYVTRSYIKNFKSLLNL